MKKQFWFPQIVIIVLQVCEGDQALSPYTLLENNAQTKQFYLADYNFNQHFTFGFWSQCIPQQYESLSYSNIENVQNYFFSKEKQFLLLLKNYILDQILLLHFTEFSIEKQIAVNKLLVKSGTFNKSLILQEFKAFDYEGQWIFILFEFNQQEAYLKISFDEIAYYKIEFKFKLEEIMIMIGGQIEIENFDDNKNQIFSYFRGRLSSPCILNISSVIEQEYLNFKQKCVIPEMLPQVDQVFYFFSELYLINQYTEYLAERKIFQNGDGYAFSGWVTVFHKIYNFEASVFLFRITTNRFQNNYKFEGDEILKFRYIINSYKKNQTAVVVSADFHKIPLFDQIGKFSKRFEKKIACKENEFIYEGIHQVSILFKLVALLLLLIYKIIKQRIRNAINSFLQRDNQKAINIKANFDCRKLFENCLYCVNTFFILEQINKLICVECVKGYYWSIVQRRCVSCDENQRHLVCQFQKVILENFDSNLNYLAQGEQYIKQCEETCLECENGTCLICKQINAKGRKQIQIDGVCIQCPYSCAVCLPRSSIQISQINPLFQNKQFMFYSNICFSSYKDKAYYFDRYLRTFIECENPTLGCQISYQIVLNLYCSSEEYFLDLEQTEEKEQYKFKKQNILFEQINQLNEIFDDEFYEQGNKENVRAIELIIVTSKPQICKTSIPLSFKNEFSSNIFSALNATIILKFNYLVIFELDNNLSFRNFSSILIQGLELKFLSNFISKLIVFESYFSQQVKLVQVNFSFAYKSDNQILMSIHNLFLFQINQTRFSNEFVQNNFIFLLINEKNQQQFINLNNFYIQKLNCSNWTLASYITLYFLTLQINVFKIRKIVIQNLQLWEQSLLIIFIQKKLKLMEEAQNLFLISSTSNSHKYPISLSNKVNFRILMLF